MSMSTSKLCGMAVIVVVIAPLLLGMVWPTDDSIEAEYVASGEISLNGSIGNRDIPIVDGYSGPQNALYILKNGFLEIPEFAQYSASPSNYPKLGDPETIEAGAVDWLSLNDYAAVVFGPMDIGTSRSISGIYYPANKMLLHQPFVGDGFDKILVDAETEVTALWDYKAYPAADPAEYGLASEGLAGRSGEFSWLNGFTNRAVEIWISTEENGTSTVRQGGWGVSVTIADGTITAYNGATGIYTQSYEIGSTAVYDYVSIRINADDDSVKIYGILNAAKINATTFSYGNGVEWGMPFTKITALEVEMPGRWWVTKTQSEIGTAKGILDAEITPTDYYPGSMWQLRFVNPAEYGDSIRFGSVTCNVNSSGQLTFTDAEGVERKTQVRGLIIASIVEDNVQTVRAGGYVVYSGPVDSDYTVYLDGPWWMSVGLAKITAENHRAFSYDGFGLDMSSYCTVGALCCGAVFIIALLWGRRSGDNVLPLMITMGLSAAAFCCFI